MGTVHAKETVDPQKGVFDTREIPFGKGEHECEQKRIVETKTVDLKGVSARVDRVHVDGLVRTKQDIITNSCKDLLNANNFEEVIKKSNDVRQKLQSLGCFKNISIFIDISTGPSSTPDGYEVTFFVSEMKRVSGGVSTNVTNNEGILAVNLALPNVLGRGESVLGEYNYGSKRTKKFNLSFSKPFINSNNLVSSLNLFQNDSEWPMSGYKVIDRGALLDLALNSKSWLKHNFQWELDWRETGVGNKYASFEIRQDAGHTLKSSLKHIMSYDGRNSKIFPSCGSLAKVSSEFAGVGGNVQFLKNELICQKNFCLFKEDLVIQLSLNAGIMNLIESPNVCDNFFLGGPLSIRGFDFRALGPGSDGNFTGGTGYWATGLHLYSPLPFRPGAGGFGDLFRLHVFANAGNVGDFESGDMGAFFNQQKEEIRLACGIGLALRLGQMARMELNYCFPIWFKESDTLVKGIQFGIGVDFL